MRPTPERLTGSRLPRLGLRARVALSVGGSITLVIVALAFAAVALAERRLETTLRDLARVTAVAVADLIELQPEPATSAAVMPFLRDLVSTEADLRAISVYRLDGGTVRLLASTSATPLVPAEAAGGVIDRQEPAWLQPTPRAEAVIVPMYQGGRVAGAVAVTVSMAAPARLAQAGRLAGVAAALGALLALTGLVNVLLHHLVLAPVDALRRVLAAARAGDLSVRATVTRQDELGDLGAGLNRMLAELQDLHRSLNERVAAATTELQQRNDQLIRSYTSLMDLRQALARAQLLAAAGQTMATVAHQIGTPLNLASAHVQLLQRVVTDPEQTRRLGTIAEQIARVSDVVRDLLQRVRPESALRPLQVAALMGRLAGASRPGLAAAGVSLDVEAEDGLPDVLADEGQLELALLNLVSNAVDAMPGGGRLTLTARARGAGVAIEVTDTGSGIPEDVLAHMFEPWVTTKPPGQGTGLGLSIARDVVRTHGGTIGVRTAAGAGTTFTIELPAAPVPVST